MNEKLRGKLTHLALALLLACGILMPVLRVLLPDVSPARPLLIAAGVCLLLEVCSLHRFASLGAAVILPLAALLWLFSPGSLPRLSDTLIALTLRLQGQEAALPLVRSDTVLFLSLLLSLLCWLAAWKEASYLPALILCVSVILLLWFSGSPELIPWLLPALTAVFAAILLDRHPQSSPLRLIALAALLVLLAFVLAPSGGVTVEPLKQKADAFRQMILDRLFYTEPRDVFSLSTEGYYPQGAGQLGGTPDLNTRPVMQVSAPRTAYLRGVILNEYDGHAWRNTAGGRRNLWQSPRLEALRDLLFDQSLPAVAQAGSLTAPSAVSVRMLSDSASTLFTPQRVRELNPGGGLVPYFSNSSEIFVTRNLQAGDTWMVSAPLFQAGDPGLPTLIEAAAPLEDRRWEEVLDAYTRLPDHLEQPVYALAAEITAGLDAPYEKAFALQSWLRRNCRYTLEVQPHPANVDFVTRFLLDTREGYCTYFASAMTVLCRMAGLPARYVEGYLAEPDARGEALVTGEDAHAWTEVYFRGFGWLTFDATPHARSESGGESPEETPPEEEPPGEEPEEEPPEEEPPEEEPPEEEPPEEEPEETEAPPAEEPTEPPAPEEPEAPETPLPDSTPEPDPDPPGSASGFPWWILPLLLLLALGARVYCTRPGFLAGRAAGNEERIRIWSQAVMDSLAAAGFRRKTGETILGFTRRVDASARFTVPLVPAGECLSVLRYAKGSASPEAAGLLRDTAEKLARELSRSARLKALIRRVFVPLARRDWMK